MLRDEALEIMLLIIDVMEEASRVPEQASWLVMCLIPKGPGKAGYRPIVLFSALWRVWARSRSFMAKELLRKMDQPFIACGAGRGTEEVVWRQATSAEAATSEGEAASVLVDVRKFDENFKLEVLNSLCYLSGLRWTLDSIPAGGG